MILNMISYFIIPFCSFFLARGTNWLASNFSVISIALSRQIAFVLWCSVVGVYFYYCLHRIILSLRPELSMKRETILLGGGCILLAISVIAPYLPERFPYLSQLHVAGSFGASVMLFFCIASVCLKLYSYAPGTFRPYLIALIWIASLSAVLFVLSGIINSAMEIFFTVSCGILVRSLHRKTVSKTTVKT